MFIPIFLISAVSGLSFVFPPLIETQVQILVLYYKKNSGMRIAINGNQHSAVMLGG